MIWIGIIAIVIYVIYKFSSDANKDKGDLNNKPLSNKFKTIVNILNQTVFDSQGKITVLNNRSFNLYKEGENKIFNFFYGTGHLTITWKYKFFQKEVVYEKIFHDVRNCSVLEQERMAEIVIREGSEVIHNHQKNLMGGII